MSELKAGVIVTPHDEGMSFDRGSDAIAVTERETEFYLKSEADKAIAEKDKEIAQLQAMLEERNKQVGELKAYIAPTPDGTELADYYLKSEADKVIADKDKKIDLYKRGWEESDRINAHIYAELLHQKYKRCLAMASYWVAVSYQCVDDKHRQRAEKHHRKWLELAEKFKEAK